MLIYKLFSSSASILSRQFKRNLMDTKNKETIIRVAIIQNNVGPDRENNLIRASKLIDETALNYADLVVLPECFSSPYGTKFFSQYAENIPNGPSCEMLSRNAKLYKQYIVGGTIPELDNGKIYNTCTVWNPEGKLIAKYRKMHLFDINIPGQISFQESSVLSAGDSLATFTVRGVKFGIGICYDLRFEELAKLYRLDDCKALIYPGAFNMTTGPLHWELIQRSRANDNQLYVLSASPARGREGYIAWGHSMVIDPWGTVIASAKEDQTVVYAELKENEIDKVRSQIPIGSQRRQDVYDTILQCKCKF